MKAVRLSDEAIDELLESAEWYRRRRPGLDARGGGTRVRLTLERNNRKTLESEYARFMSIYRGN